MSKRRKVHPVTGHPWVIVDSTIPEEIGKIYLGTVDDYSGVLPIEQKKKDKDHVV